MRRHDGVTRLCVVAILAVAGLTACEDVGLADRNLPLDDARARTYGYTVYDATSASQPVAAAGRHWIAGPPATAIPAHMLVPVGNEGDPALYSLRGQAAPYEQLYAPAGDGRWRPWVRLN